MKKSKKVLIIKLSTLVLLCILIYFRLQPIWELGKFPSAPSSIESFTTRGNFITSKYGLTIYPTCDFANQSFDEVHVLMPKSFASMDQALLEGSRIIRYDHKQFQYPIDGCLNRIFR